MWLTNYVHKAPKTNCNPVKLASVITYMQKSCVAHSIKDLEKQLPSVASINGMQVKGLSRITAVPSTVSQLT